MDIQNETRRHVLELLEGRSAHIDIASALEDFPLSEINTRVANSPHTAWQLLEHIRLAQRDILEFSRDPHYKERTFPDDYWPTADGTPDNWKASVEQTLRDLQAMRDMVANADNDLFAAFPWGSGQTLFREAMVAADHNSYHLGQVMLLKKMLA